MIDIQMLIVMYMIFIDCYDIRCACATLERILQCSVCQKQKKQHKKYGLLPEKEAEYKPWEWLCVDLIGPYKI